MTLVGDRGEAVGGRAGAGDDVFDLAGVTGTIEGHNDTSGRDLHQGEEGVGVSVPSRRQVREDLGLTALEAPEKPAATGFFARALEQNGLPRKIVIDKSGANTAGITAINSMLKRFGCRIPIEVVRIKFLNNI